MSTQKSPANIFENSLNRFKIGLSDREKEDFELTSLDEVHGVVLKIQETHASELKMQNMNRLSSFLEGMEQYGSVIEVFLNASSFLAFVWGPVKFLLLVARNWTESLSLLLDAYEQIGEAIPQLLQYDKLFTGNPAMQRVLGLIYGDILEFHRRALVVFKRKSWKQLFHSTWKSFSTHFKRLLENLQRHKLDIEREASLIEVKRNQVQREAQEKQILSAEKLERERQAISVVEKISPVNFNLDQENISKFWTKEQQFGLWLLKDTKMTAWLDSKDLDTDVLWLKGIPGAGKSVLISRVIAEKRSLKPLIFFYCKYEDRSQNSLIAVLKAFLAQLIQINPEVLSHIYEEVSARSELILETVDFLKRLVGYVLEGSDPLWIIIDGLDECDKKEKKKIMSWLIGILEAEEHPGRIRLLVVSQDDGDIRKLLSKRPTISLNNASQHQEAIRNYAIRKSNKIKTKLELPISIERNIVELVTDRSKGMFLFARLVLKHLKSQITLQELEKEINPHQFPVGLYDIYDRIIGKIHSNGAQQSLAADRILAWIVRSKRPLKWHEIQSIFAIDPQNKVVDFSGRRLRGVDIKDLCGSLVEISTSGAIELVHHTVRSYLLDQSRPKVEPRVNSRTTDIEIATTCLQYLCFRCFDGNLTDQEIFDYTWQGCYSFQDFATAYWLEYLCASFETKIREDPEASKKLSLLFDNFMEFHYQGQERVQEVTNAFSTACESDQVKRISSLISDLQVAWKVVTTSENTTANQYLFVLREQLNRRRSIFEKIVLELPSNDLKRDELSTFYGDPSGWFKCSRIQCLAFYEGFQSPVMKKAHVERHQRPFRCTVEACTYSVIGFSSAGELKRHCSKNHPTPIEEREATIPRFIIPDMEEDKALERSGLNAKFPIASSIWHRDATGMELDQSKENETFRKLVQDNVDWEIREGVEDNWQALLNPNSPISVDVELQYTIQHPSVAACVAFSKDGRYLATGCVDTCQIFDTASGKVLYISPPHDIVNNYCRSVCFSPCGRYFVSAWEGKLGLEIRVINDQGISEVIQRCIGHTSDIHDIDISNDNSLLASGGGDKTVRIWSFPAGLHKKTLKFGDAAANVRISPDSQVVAVSCLDHCIYIWNIAKGHLLASLKGHNESVYSSTFMEKGMKLVTASLDKTIMLWDITMGFDYNVCKDISPYKTLEGHSDFALDVVTMSEDRNILSSSKDRCVRLWDPSTGRCKMILKGHKSTVIRVAAAPTGKTFATASGDMTVRVWKYKEMDRLTRIESTRSDWLLAWKRYR